MARRSQIRLLIAAVAVPMLVLGFDRVQMIRWVGSTDLEVGFAVTDASTGGPVPGARVEVQSDGGLYAEDFKQEFTLVADAGGSARKDCPRSMCFGTQSGLRFTDTFVVHLPFWRYRVLAEGYQSSEWALLAGRDLRRQVLRAGPGKAKLVVPVPLHKRQAEPSAELHLTGPTRERHGR